MIEKKVNLCHLYFYKFRSLSRIRLTALSLQDNEFIFQRICLKGITYCLFSVVNFYLFQGIANMLHTLKRSSHRIHASPCIGPIIILSSLSIILRYMVTSRIKADHITIKKCINSIKKCILKSIKENTILSGKLDMIIFM